MSPHPIIAILYGPPLPCHRPPLAHGRPPIAIVSRPPVGQSHATSPTSSTLGRNLLLSPRSSIFSHSVPLPTTVSPVDSIHEELPQAPTSDTPPPPSNLSDAKPIESPSLGFRLITTPSHARRLLWQTPLESLPNVQVSSESLPMPSTSPSPEPMSSAPTPSSFPADATVPCSRHLLHHQLSIGYSTGTHFLPISSSEAPLLCRAIGVFWGGTAHT